MANLLNPVSTKGTKCTKTINNSRVLVKKTLNLKYFFKIGRKFALAVT